MFYVYVLKSLKDNKYYYGYTSDIKRRIKQHNSGKVYSTRHRRPLQMIGFKSFINMDQALKFEKPIKRNNWQRDIFVKQLDNT